VDSATGRRRLEVHLPFAPGRANRTWLESAVPGKETRSEWDSDARCWRVAKAHFTDLVRAMAERFGAVRVEVEYNTRMVCTESCKNAQRDDCECSCPGRSHGGGRWLDGWIDLGEITVGYGGRTCVAYDVRGDRMRAARLVRQAMTRPRGGAGQGAAPLRSGPGPQWYCPTDDQWSDADDWTTQVETEPGHRESWHTCPNGHNFPGSSPNSRRGATTKARTGDGTAITAPWHR
jgi:hypothetical protein